MRLLLRSCPPRWRAGILVAALAGVGLIVAGVLGDGLSLVVPREQAAPAERVEVEPPAHRSAAVAGQFYPADPAQLRTEVTGCLERAGEAAGPGKPATRPASPRRGRRASWWA